MSDRKPIDLPYIVDQTARAIFGIACSFLFPLMMLAYATGWRF